VSKCGLVVSPETAREVIRHVAQGRRLDGFGNAGEVEVRLKTAALNQYLCLLIIETIRR
jgi:hypothetical protein